jgi:Flp pilus assembly protein TadD
MEKTALITIAFSIVATSLAGCAGVAEKNADQCEQMMQSKAEPALVSVSKKQPSSDGRSVLVTGMIEDQRLNTVVPAKVECRFNGKSLAAFRWLAPATLADSDDAQTSSRNLAH